MDEDDLSGSPGGSSDGAAGDSGSISDGTLFAELYDQIRRLAGRQLQSQSPAHTLQPTDLVNETYLKLVKKGRQGDWRSRAHFMATMAKAMRQILVDHARRRNRQKRKAEGARVPLDGLLDAYESRTGDMMLLDGALTRLADKGGQGARAAQVFELLFFCGLTIPETAEVLEVSERTIDRDWALAQASLRRDLG